MNTPVPVNEVIFSDITTTWKNDFTKIPVGHYLLNIKVYIYLMGFEGWKIGEKTINVQVQGWESSLLANCV